MPDLQLVLVFRPEACGDPLGPHAFTPFEGIEILAKLPKDQIDPFISRMKLHNPTWSFHIENDISDQA